MEALGLWLGAVVCGAMLCGCEAPGNTRRGAKTILELMAPPPREQAAKMARNAYNANDRFQGTSQLAGAPYGAEPENIQIYLTNSDDTDPGVRAAALRALGMHGSAEHAPLIAQHLNDEDRVARADAARSLQRIHAPAVVPALIDRLSIEREPDGRVRLEVARALGQYRENRVVEALISVLSDDEFAVTDAAVSSLRTLTGQDLSSDSRAWIAWYKQTRDVFAAGSGYTYPIFQRSKYIWEYIPLLPQPPNESPGLPVGMSPSMQ